MSKYIQTESDLIAGDNAKLKQLVVEARAKIIWGERVEDVRDWLITHDVSESNASLIVQTCVRERTQTIRDRGKDDMIKGGLALTGGLVLGGLLYLLKSHLPDIFSGIPGS